MKHKLLNPLEIACVNDVSLTKDAAKFREAGGNGGDGRADLFVVQDSSPPSVRCNTTIAGRGGAASLSPEGQVR
ncbi:MAG TPA: hypothetical protein VF592_03525 [Sphingomonas sp.]|jgi:hypothetical protein|uniref:hypothetical protein n=1 Tax=Sphingomonas sp. TaxID=28214 RepID=UPI002ED810CF